jgi:hypothetical protein
MTKSTDMSINYIISDAYTKSLYRHLGFGYDCDIHGINFINLSESIVEYEINSIFLLVNGINSSG